jgi:hypothetical protein
MACNSIGRGSSEGVSDAARKTAAGSRQGRLKWGLSHLAVDFMFMALGDGKRC